MTDQVRKIIELLNSKDQEECKLGLSLGINVSSNSLEMREAIASAILTTMSSEVKRHIGKNFKSMVMIGFFGDSPSDLHERLKTLDTNERRNTEDSRAD